MGYTPTAFEFRRTSGVWSAYAPSSTSGDDLYIYPNTTDTSCYLTMTGGGSISAMNASAGGFYIYCGTSNAFIFYYATPDVIIKGLTDKNIYLLPQGTGKVKFGTRTAQADTAVTGYIDILDSAGTARKLATILDP